MPDMNGLETYLAIKDVNPKITAVMITGCGQEVAELVEEAIRNNAYTCLHKPIDMDRLAALVEEISRLRRAGDL
jgi:two-component system response regulator HydG